MKYATNLILLALTFMMLGGCKVEPQAIPYGEVGCAYCQMTVIKPQFATELVTSTGKTYYFDAIECMVHYIAANPRTKWSYQLVSDYFNPNHLIEAAHASYLISEAIPSPMGANLSATSDPESWDSIIHDQAGNLYTWEELNRELTR